MNKLQNFLITVYFKHRWAAAFFISWIMMIAFAVDDVGAVVKCSNAGQVHEWSYVFKVALFYFLITIIPYMAGREKALMETQE